MQEAVAYARSGLSVIPIQPGTKKSRIKWEKYQRELMVDAEIRSYFDADQNWLAVVCGPVSGNLEVLDFDCPDKIVGQKSVPPMWAPFCKLLKEHGHTDLLKKLVAIQTQSGGMHLVYRCPESIAGNTKLAHNKSHAVTIETRGAGGYFLTDPTPGYCTKNGSLCSVPQITAEERTTLLETASYLTEAPINEAPADTFKRSNWSVGKPGEAYSASVDWSEVLSPYGWAEVRGHGDRRHWVRPGKSAKDGLSATTGNGDTDLLYIFSSNCHPFAERTSYSKFAAITHLKYQGDFHHAARALQELGFGEKKRTPVTKEDYAPKGSMVVVVRSNDDGSLATEGIPENFTPVEAEWQVAGILPKNKAILFDADGGTGKTSFAAAQAAWCSNGFSPVTGEKISHFSTLYLHRGEDSNDEISTIYTACGGRRDGMRYYRHHLVFDQAGIDMVQRTVEKEGHKVIVVDAFFYFLLGLAKDTNDSMVALAVMERWNSMLEETGCTALDLRHTRKNTVDAQASALGLGTVQFRNSHRGQFVARWHPDEKGIVCVESAKDSLLYQLHPFWSYRRVGNEVQIIQNATNPFVKEGAKARPISYKIEDAKVWILGVLQEGWERPARLATMASEVGFTKATFDRARLELATEQLITRSGTRTNLFWGLVGTYNAWSEEEF